MASVGLTYLVWLRLTTSANEFCTHCKGVGPTLKELKYNETKTGLHQP